MNEKDKHKQPAEEQENGRSRPGADGRGHVPKYTGTHRVQEPQASSPEPSAFSHE
jgi:hypothetical protein